MAEVPSLQSFLADLRSRSPSMSRKRSRAPHCTLEERFHGISTGFPLRFKLSIVSRCLKIYHVFPTFSNMTMYWQTSRNTLGRFNRETCRISWARNPHPWPTSLLPPALWHRYHQARRTPKRCRRDIRFIWHVCCIYNIRIHI